MSTSGLRGVVEERRVNATLGWLVVGFLLVVAGREILYGEVVWGVLVLVATVVAIVPPVAFRDATAMLPWEVLALAALPAIGRTFVAGEEVAGVTLTGRVTTYLAVATVALIVAVEIDVFTPVRMNYSFAVLFVTMTTMAAAALWALLRYASDVFLGTEFLLDGRPERVVEAALMWDFVAATLAGVAAGVLFELYFRRRADPRRRLPEEVPDA